MNTNNETVIPITFSLKTKDGLYAWMYNDGSERFPGKSFPSEQEAKDFIAEYFGVESYSLISRKYVDFDPTLPPTKNGS